MNNNDKIREYILKLPVTNNAVAVDMISRRFHLTHQQAQEHIWATLLDVS